MLSYFFEGTSQEVCVSKEEKAWFSMSCHQKPNCDAIGFWKNLEKIQFKVTSGGEAQNPGVLLCHKLGGKILQGRNDRGSQNSFCQAKDQSFVDVASIYQAYLRLLRR